MERRRVTLHGGPLDGKRAESAWDGADPPEVLHFRNMQAPDDDTALCEYTLALDEGEGFHYRFRGLVPL